MYGGGWWAAACEDPLLETDGCVGTVGKRGKNLEEIPKKMFSEREYDSERYNDREYSLIWMKIYPLISNEIYPLIF